MKSGKDPLFPRLHINDADKGAPPRNKMALCERYNAPSQSPKFKFGSMLHIRPSNGHSSFVPQAFSSQPKEKRSGDQSREHQRNHTDKDNKVSQHTEIHEEKPSLISTGDEFSAQTASTPLAENNMSELGTKALESVYHHKKSNLMDKPSRFCYPYAKPCQECKVPQEVRAITDGMSEMNERIIGKRCTSAMADAVNSYPRIGDNNGQTKSETIKACSVQVANTDKKQEISDTSVADSVPVLDLTPDDVVGETILESKKNNFTSAENFCNADI